MLDRLRSDGLISRIIISTWNEELRDNGSVLTLANKYNCEIVSSPDPGTALFPGSELKSSMAPQTIGLRQALAAIDDDDMVLKTRPDIVLNEDFVKSRLVASGASDFNAAPGSPFKKKIWVPWADFIFPFLIADEVFLGRCGDLKLLATDFYRQYRPGKIVHGLGEHAHVLRYLAAFESGVFADFFKNWVYLQYELPLLPAGWTEYVIVKFQTSLWWVLIAKYVSILCDNFIIDGGRPADIVFYVKSGDRSSRTAPKEISHFYPGTAIPIALKPNVFLENVTAIRSRVVIMNDMEWLKNVRYGNIHGDAFYDSVFLPALVHMQGLEARGEVPDLGPAIIDTIKKMKSPDIDLAPLSHPDWQISRQLP